MKIESADVTRVGGAYFLNHVHMPAPFTVSVSYPGFETVEKVHEGIFDKAAGYALSPPLNFVLDKNGWSEQPSRLCSTCHLEPGCF